MNQLPIHYEELESIYAETVAHGHRTVTITAATRGEGVSMLAYALARRTAANGKKVLLVDFNTARPSVAPNLGFTEVIWRPAVDDWEEALIQCPIGLDLLPAPTGSEGIMKLREETVLQDHITQWSAIYDLIVFDTSPLTMANQSNIPPERVAKLSDATILVTLAARTPETKVTEAITKLRTAGACLVGTVLNDKHNPGVADELCRETRRLERLLPTIMQKIRNVVRTHPFLNQEI